MFFERVAVKGPDPKMTDIYPFGSDFVNQEVIGTIFDYIFCDLWVMENLFQNGVQRIDSKILEKSVKVCEMNCCKYLWVCECAFRDWRVEWKKTPRRYWVHHL